MMMNLMEETVKKTIILNVNMRMYILLNKISLHSLTPPIFTYEGKPGIYDLILRFLPSSFYFFFEEILNTEREKWNSSKSH